jgi:hypothetical protein
MSSHRRTRLPRRTASCVRRRVGLRPRAAVGQNRQPHRARVPLPGRLSRSMEPPISCVNALYDGQAQPGAALAVLRRLSCAKASKACAANSGVHAPAGIPHDRASGPDFAVLRGLVGQPQRDLAPGGREFQGVGQQIQKDLIEPKPVDEKIFREIPRRSGAEAECFCWAHCTPMTLCTVFQKFASCKAPGGASASRLLSSFDMSSTSLMSASRCRAERLISPR